MPRAEGVLRKMKFVSLFSGGLDSVCYTAMHKQSKSIEALIFDFGQKAQAEVHIATDLAMKLGINFTLLDLNFLRNIWRKNQLTDPNVQVTEDYDPSVVVPLRNGIFLMIALSFAHSIDATGILMGAQISSTKKFRHGDHDDFKFPDCTPSFIDTMALAGINGTFRCAEPVRIYTPAMEGLDKSDLVTKGYEILGNDIFHTWTCRNNGLNQCGICEACKGRRHAFKLSEIEDKTTYAS